MVEPYIERWLTYSNNFIILPLISITEGGVRFPLQPFLQKYMSHYELPPCQLTINFFQIVNSVIALVRENGL